MTLNRRTVVASAFVLFVLRVSMVSAQVPATRPGWTFVPSFGLSQTYDDNITLWGRSDAEEQNNDFITSYVPRADVIYTGRHTHLSGGYGGSFLNYQTYTIFNRWHQTADVSIRRTENARLDWSANVGALKVPSTEWLDFDGIPFSHTGATATTARAGIRYKPGAHHEIATSVQGQKVRFDRPGELREYLRGGEALQSLTSYNRRVSARLSLGANYQWQRAEVVGDFGQVSFHAVRAAVSYQLTRSWTLNAGSGMDFAEGTPTSPGQRAPGAIVSASRSEGGTHFSVGYQRMFLPSLGYGGAIQSEQLGVSYRTPLFRSRHFYTDHSVIFRDTRPLIESAGQLRLRSLRTMSAIGWAPQPWVRIESFYARVEQSTLIPGGHIERNRIGFQIVTSRPVRMQ